MLDLLTKLYNDAVPCPNKVHCIERCFQLVTGEVIEMFANSSAKKHFTASFLADRTNGRAIATLLRLSSSSSVCDVMYCG